MKLILVLALFCSVVLAQEPQPLDFDWRNLKDIWEHPRLQSAAQNFRSRFGIQKGRNAEQRGIVGGSYARTGQFPFHALTVIDDMWWCGSSILNANWALTAAHCIYLSHYAQLYSIVDLNIGYYWTSASAQLIVHETYDDEYITDDIGLIRLATPAPNNVYTSYINLPHIYDGNSFAGYLSTIQGFGVFSDAAPEVSEVKRYVPQTIIDNNQCEVWRPPLSQLCTDTTAGGGPCNGDSGGGLFIGDRDNHNTDRTVVGIVSYGALAGCQLGYPAAFTRVTYYIDWIDRHIAA